MYFVQALDHPHIQGLLGVYAALDELLLVQEYCSGGEVYHTLQVTFTRIRSPCRLRILLQVL